MSFGFSLSDIVTSCQLAYTIYDRCFTRANGADYRYLEFGREIKALGASLTTLDSVISNADKQNQLPRRPWHSDTDRYGPSWDVLPEVVGDFKHTLEECDAFLRDHSKFQYSQGGFIENVIWWSSVEAGVNALKERVRFHMMKLTFVAKPFEIQLLLEIKRELQLLRADVQELKTILVDSLHHGDSQGSTYLQSLEVPPELSNRFWYALQASRPASMQSEADMPLKEGFDALVYHFAKSTILFNPQPELRQRDPDEPKYLNLVKCRWIAYIIRQSPSFQLAGPESLWADYMKELEDDIRRQFRRFDSGQLVSPPLNRISLLPDSCFSIWVVEESPIRPPDLAEQRPFEEKILQLDLPGNFGTRKSTLTIFRKSESKMRLVTTTTDERNSYFHSEKETDVNMMATRLIPTYAAPSDASTMTNNVMICSNEGQDPRWYSLKNGDDVLDFQRALTGFRVFCQMLHVGWSIEGSSKPTKFGNGSIQLWHLKPFQPIGETGERILGDGSSVGSPRSPLENDRLSRKSTGFSTGTTLFSNGNSASTVNGPQGSGTALLRTELPRLMIFTQSSRAYVILQLLLNEHIYINPKKTKKPNTVILSTTANHINLVRMTVTELSSWDLAYFRFPTHPEMRKLEQSGKGYIEGANRILETTSMKYLNLDFPTLQEKELFCKEFNRLRVLREVHQTSYNKTLMAERQMANNPGSPVFLQPPNRSARNTGIFATPSKRTSAVSSLGSISSQSTGAPISPSSSIDSSARMHELSGASRPIPELGDTALSTRSELGQQDVPPSYFRNVDYSGVSELPDVGSLAVTPAENGQVRRGYRPYRPVESAYDYPNR